jgi:hypothetical protein
MYRIVILSIIIMSAAIFTAASAMGYKQGNSAVGISVCTNDEPCHNSKTVCQGNGTCNTTEWNSTTSSSELITETE